MRGLIRPYGLAVILTGMVFLSISCHKDDGVGDQDGDASLFADTGDNEQGKDSEIDSSAQASACEKLSKLCDLCS